MIIDIQKGAFAKGLIEYHEKKVVEGTAAVIYNNTLEDKTNEKIAVFLETADQNTRIRSNKFLHFSVSFNKSDKPIEPHFMARIGEEYLQEMGITDTPVLMYHHTDKSHQHFHIVTTTMNHSGVKIEDAHDHYRSQRLSRKMEKELGLVLTEYSTKHELKLQELNATKYRIYNSLAVPGPDALAEIKTILTSTEIDSIRANKLSDYAIQQLVLKRGIDTNQFNVIWRVLQKHDLSSRSHKETMIDRLKQLKALSFSREDFLSKVEKSGIYVRRIAGKASTYSLTYGLVENNFYVKEKQLPTEFRYDFLYTGKKVEQAFDRNQQIKYLKRIVSRALQSANSKENFEQLLTENNVRYEYASNARGIYGISFASENVKNATLFKGSEIDRSLTWNKISAQLSIETSTAKASEKSQPAIPETTTALPSSLARMFDSPEDEETKKRKKKNQQDQDLDRD